MNIEIIVVDNNSKDDSLSMLNREFPDVITITNHHNVGFATANNQAIRMARGKYLLLLNPDTRVLPGCLPEMVSFMDKNSPIGMAGCKILNIDGTLQPACRRSIPNPRIAFYKVVGLSSLFPKSKIFSRYNVGYLDPDEGSAVEAISGSFMFVRKSVVDEVGMLDERFFMYGEDLDWCYRFLKKGYGIYYNPKAQIIHYKGESSKKNKLLYIRCFHEAMVLFYQKHYHSNVFLTSTIRLVILASMYARLAFHNIYQPKQFLTSHL